MFRLNESVEMNTKKLCNLNESSDKSAKSLQARGTRQPDGRTPAVSCSVGVEGVAQQNHAQNSTVNVLRYGGLQ